MLQGSMHIPQNQDAMRATNAYLRFQLHHNYHTTLNKSMQLIMQLRSSLLLLLGKCTGLFVYASALCRTSLKQRQSADDSHHEVQLE